MFPRTSDASANAGGRAHARRLLAMAALIVLAVRLPATAASDTSPKVTVREDDGVYTVAATFSISQPASVAVAVLTAYEQIARFMPDVRTSNVLERGEDRAIIEQETVARFMMFSKRVHLVLEVQEEPGTIRFRDRCGKSFRRYEGAWTITEKDGQTAIAYELTAEPSFDVPWFVLKRLLHRDSAQMIERLQREIAARATTRAGLTPQSLK